MTVSQTIQNPPNIDWQKMVKLMEEIQGLENDLLTNPENAQKDLSEMKGLAGQLVQLDTDGYSPPNDGSFHAQLLALQNLITTMQGGGFNPLNEMSILPDVGQFDGLAVAIMAGILV